jgi:predicted ferric reductase
MAAISSIRIARRKMRYETWWVVHLYTYLGLSLAFAHQIMTGVTFVGHPLAKAIWIAAWVFAGVVIFSFRFLYPVLKNLRYRLKIASILEENPGVYSIICTGKNLEKLGVSGGQFFQWRFLHKGLWWQAHPFSISALPRPPFLRLTVKALGDQSAAVAALPAGTRVMIEGPYGAFTHHARVSDRVALIGAGIGITPIRSLLEDLPHEVDVVTIVRGRSQEDLIHHEELLALTKERRGRLCEVIGSRPMVTLDAAAIKQLIPDIAGRDVYICGPDAFASDMVDALRRDRVPIAQIHLESFAF